MLPSRLGVLGALARANSAPVFLPHAKPAKTEGRFLSAPSA